MAHRHSNNQRRDAHSTIPITVFVPVKDRCFFDCLMRWNTKEFLTSYPDFDGNLTLISWWEDLNIFDILVFLGISNFKNGENSLFFKNKTYYQILMAKIYSIEVSCYFWFLFLNSHTPFMMTLNQKQLTFHLEHHDPVVVVCTNAHLRLNADHCIVLDLHLLLQDKDVIVECYHLLNRFSSTRCIVTHTIERKFFVSNPNGMQTHQFLQIFDTFLFPKNLRYISLL